ncbi:DNA gyrase inhibitor YacG [Paludisphaera borealis]|uniref:DNA gyrase inhibitor YacG n=1 Tax=Paludisphaera borealis TaxID=1387353 RepID=UPI0028525E27|nr:DNA gyrase inhibitor YacG [Paludisphaera borealis]
MMKARCPICSKTFEADRNALPPGFPFCSERCKLIDLGRWIDGAYSVPGPPADRDPDSPRGDAATAEPNDALDDSES